MGRVLDVGAERDRRPALGVLAVGRDGVTGDGGLVHDLGQVALVVIATAIADVGEVWQRGGVVAEGREQALIDQVPGGAGGHEVIEELVEALAIETLWCGGETQKSRVAGCLDDAEVGLGDRQVAFVDDDQSWLGQDRPPCCGLHRDHLHHGGRIRGHAGHDETVLDALTGEPAAGVEQDFLQVSEEPDDVAASDGGADDFCCRSSLAAAGRRN